jgi:hypothetical protein
MSNAASNAARLARLAGVPCPALNQEDFSFAVWADGPDWGHIDVAQNKVTRWNAEVQRHEQIYPT